MLTTRAWTVLFALAAVSGCSDDPKPKPATTAAADSGAPGDAADAAADADAGAAVPTSQEAGGKVADGGAGTTSTTGAAADETGGDETGGGETGGDETGGGETGGGDETGGDETGAEEPAADPKKDLLSEVTNRKTKDDRALEALAEAKTAGATDRELASAANKRGTRLFSTPDRARPFFEYARDADARYADASFNLAKLSAMTGEIPTIIEHLTDVKKRGGKRLLQTVEYDPTFALVADDPDVLALLK